MTPNDAIKVLSCISYRILLAIRQLEVPTLLSFKTVPTQNETLEMQAIRNYGYFRKLMVSLLSIIPNFYNFNYDNTSSPICLSVYLNNFFCDDATKIIASN